MDMKKKLLRIIIITIVTISLFFVLSEILEAQRERVGQEGILIGWAEEMMMMPYLPGIRMMNQDAADKITGDIYEGWILAEYPVLFYSMENGQDEDTVPESDYARLLMMEGSDEERKAISEDGLEYDESAMHLEQNLADALLAENGMYLENQNAAQQEKGKAQEQENTSVEFIPVKDKSYSYNWEELESYEMLVKAFYAVDSTTKAGEELLRVDRLLSEDMSVKGSSNTPQILIYHTHSQEAFADSAAVILAVVSRYPLI